MLNVWRLTDNHPTAIACSVLWSPFLRLGWNSGKVPPKNTEWSCFNSNNSNIWKIYKKKLTKKTPYDFKIGKCYDRRKMLPPPHLLVICVCDDKNNGWTTCTDRTSSRLQKQTKQKNPHLTLSISQGSATNGGSVLMNITGQIDWSSPRSPNTKAARGRRTGNSPLT